MGHRDLFSTANDLLHEQLGYRLHPDHADHFRAIIARAGSRRVAQAVRLTLTQSPESPSEAHTILEGYIWELTPKKPISRPLRNAQAQSARAQMAAMDARVMELVADDRQ